MKIDKPYQYTIEDKAKLLEMLNYFYKDGYSSIEVYGSDSTITFYLKQHEPDYYIKWGITSFCILYLLEEIQLLKKEGWDKGKLLDAYIAGIRLGLGSPVEFLYKRFIENKDK